MSKWNTDICKGIESEMTAEELWKKSGLAGTYEAWPFGGAPDKLADLVLQRIKTATCSAYDLYQIENEPLPQAGDPMKLEYIPSHYKSYHTEFSVLRRNNL